MFCLKPIIVQSMSKECFFIFLKGYKNIKHRPCMATKPRIFTLQPSGKSLSISPLEKLCLAELSMMVKIFLSLLSQNGSHKTHAAIEYFKYGQHN